MAFDERRQILLASELDDLYGIPALDDEQRRQYFSLNSIEVESAARIHNLSHRCFFVALLGYFKIKPICLNASFGDTESELRFIASEHYNKAKLKRFTVSPAQISRFYKRIFELVNYHEWNKSWQARLSAHANEIAATCIEPRYLFDTCIEFLAVNRVAIPRYTVLQTTVSKAIHHERQRIETQLEQHITPQLSQALEDMLSNNAGTSINKLNYLPKSFNATELEKELLVFNHIKAHIQDVGSIIKRLQLSQKNLHFYASMVEYYTIGKLRRFAPVTVNLYLLCYLSIRHQRLIEHLADGLIYHVRRIKDKARTFAKDAAYQDWQQAAKNMDKAAQVLRLFIDGTIDETVPFGEIKKKAIKLIPETALDSVCLYMASQKRAEDDFLWQFYDQQSDLITNILRPIFLCLRFKGSEHNTPFIQYIQNSQKSLLKSGSINEMDENLVRPKARRYLITEDNTVHAQRAEWYLYMQIQTKLDGQLFIPDSHKYRALEDDFISDSQWKEKDTLVKNACMPKLEVPPNKLLTQLNEELQSKLDGLSQQIQDSDDSNIILQSTSGKKRWRLPTKGTKKLLNNPFFQQVKPTNIADVLRYVDHHTQFIDAFEHVRKSLPIRDGQLNNLLATIIANGTNYGIYTLANISDRHYNQLRSIQANYLRRETLVEANDAICNAIARLPIFKHYQIQDNLLHASADGQKFESRLETFKTRYASKYFGTNKGVSAVTLVANHAAINAKMIGANEHESHFIYDLLYSNTSDIKPDILSTDTHGVNHVNFALLDLSGYTFAPRYANVGGVIDDLFNMQNEQLALKTPIDIAVIESQWDVVQRIMISLQRKTTTQAALVRKLSGYPKDHPLLKAITEYNRLVKALYILNYMGDEKLRKYVQRALNRGEAYHQLRRAIASVNGNRFRGSTDYEIELWNDCARLLTNAIIYFNSLVLSKLLVHFENTKQNDMLTLTQRVSPVAWTNINLNGTYSFNFGQDILDMDELIRPITEEEVLIEN